LDEDCSLEDTIDFIEAIMNEFTEFIENLFGAKITVCQTQEKFTDLHRDGEVEKELNSLSILFNKQNHARIAEQIETMFKLAKIKGSAEAMKKVASILEAKTDLSPCKYSRITIQKFYKVEFLFEYLGIFHLTFCIPIKDLGGQNFSSIFFLDENSGVFLQFFA
jgi:hypothetical protein